MGFFFCLPNANCPKFIFLYLLCMTAHSAVTLCKNGKNPSTFSWLGYIHKFILRAIINTFVGWYMLLLSYLKVQFIVRKKYHLCLHNYLHSTLKPVHFCIWQNAAKNFVETKVLRKNLGQNSAHRLGFITILSNLVNSWWWWGSI